MLILSMIAQSDAAPVRLETSGLVLMTLSILLVCGLTVFCAVKILCSKSPSEHHHVPLDIDTHDVDK